MEDMEEMEEMEEDVFIGKALRQSQKPYKWAMYGEWEPLKEFYKKKPDEVVRQLSTNNDTVLHVVAGKIVVVVAGHNDVLQFLIDLIKEPNKLLYAFSTGNSYGNTILHEMAASGNLEATVILMSEENKVKEKYRSYKSMLEIQNTLGETPLYRAAAFGHTNLVKYLASQVKLQPQQQDIEQQDIEKQQEEAIEYHFNRNHDNLSILQIAVISQHFGIYPSTDDLKSRINEPSQSSCSQNITSN
ncbi:unnamed protein product [Prunus brigantina]